MNFDGFDEDANGNRPSFVQQQGPDRGLRVRMWIAGVLVVFIVLLFVAERFITLVQPNLDRMQEKRDVASIESLQEDVERILNDYGIQPEWIRRKVVEVDDLGHVRDLWLIRVPHNLPFASLNLDLKMMAEQYQGKAFAVENAKEAQISLHIVFRKTIRYSLIFNPTREVQRQTGNIVLLVDGLESASEGDIDRLIQSREHIAAILEPSKDAIALHTRLRAAGRDIALHLHFKPAQELGSRFELSEDLRPEQVQSHLRYIVRNFPGCRAYYVTSERAPGLYMRTVEEEMRSQGIRKLESSLLTYIDRSSQQNVMSTRMNDIAALAVREGTAVGVVELRPEVLSFLETEMGRLRKKGFAFVRLAGADLN
jgi:polysaccharide deacetylase 2 family uncharacterized protein YibQ